MTAILHNATTLEESLHNAFPDLRECHVHTLATAIEEGTVRLPAYELTLGELPMVLRQSLLMDWITGCGMPFQWVNTLVATLSTDVRSLKWDPECAILEVGK